MSKSTTSTKNILGTAFTNFPQLSTDLLKVGSMTYPTVDGSSGYQLTTNGSGTIYWSNPLSPTGNFTSLIVSGTSSLNGTVSCNIINASDITCTSLSSDYVVTGYVSTPAITYAGPITLNPEGAAVITVTSSQTTISNDVLLDQYCTISKNLTVNAVTIADSCTIGGTMTCGPATTGDITCTSIDTSGGGITSGSINASGTITASGNITGNIFDLTGSFIRYNGTTSAVITALHNNLQIAPFNILTANFSLASLALTTPFTCGTHALTCGSVSCGAITSTSSISGTSLALSNQSYLRVSRATNISVVTSIYTTITFDTTESTVGSNITLSNPTTVTINNTGFYNIIFQNTFAASGTNTSRGARIAVNATTVAEFMGCNGTAGSPPANVTQVHYAAQLTATNQLTFLVWQSNGANLNSTNSRAIIYRMW